MRDCLYWTRNITMSWSTIIIYYRPSEADPLRRGPLSWRTPRFASLDLL